MTPAAGQPGCHGPDIQTPRAARSAVIAAAARYGATHG
jgi:hypothetical protein